MGCYNFITKDDLQQMDKSRPEEGVLCLAGVMFAVEQRLAELAFQKMPGASTPRGLRGKAGEAFTEIRLDELLACNQKQIITHPTTMIGKQPDFLVIRPEIILTEGQRKGQIPPPKKSCIAVVDSKAWNVMYKKGESQKQHEARRQGQPAASELINTSALKKVVSSYAKLQELTDDGIVCIIMPDDLLRIHPQIKSYIEDLSQSETTTRKVRVFGMGRDSDQIEGLARRIK